MKERECELFSFSNLLYQASESLRRLTHWCHHPDPKPLSFDWLDKTKDDFQDAIQAAIRASQNAGDRKTEGMLRKAQKKALELAALLVNRPELSTVRFDLWQSESRRRLVEDIERIANDIEAVENARAPGESSESRPDSPRCHHGPDYRDCTERH